MRRFRGRATPNYLVRRRQLQYSSSCQYAKKESLLQCQQGGLSGGKKTFVGLLETAVSFLSSKHIDDHLRQIQIVILGEKQLQKNSFTIKEPIYLEIDSRSMIIL